MLIPNKMKAFLVGLLAVITVDSSIILESDIILNLLGSTVYFLVGLFFKKYLTEKETDKFINHVILLFPLLFFMTASLYVTINGNKLLFPIVLPNLFIICLVSYSIGILESISVVKIIITWFLCVVIYCLFFIPDHKYETKQKAIVQPLTVYSLYTLDNKPVTVFNQGDSIVLLDFWFIGCGQCMMKFPYLQELSDKYENNQKVKIYAVALGKHNTEKEIKTFVKKHKIKLNILYDKENLLANQIGYQGAPHELIIYKKVIKSSNSGFNSDMAISYLKNTSLKIDKVFEKSL